jgi:hypothetical protein
MKGHVNHDTPEHYSSPTDLKKGEGFLIRGLFFNLQISSFSSSDINFHNLSYVNYSGYIEFLWDII